MAVQVFTSLLLLFSVKFSGELLSRLDMISRYSHSMLFYDCIHVVQSVTINAARLGAAEDYQGTGAVEVFMIQYNSWLPVCSTSWDDSAESQVLCRQLGFNTTSPGILLTVD